MNNISWDDLRLFLAVARTGRFLAAGRSLNLNHATIGRRIANLEANLGVTLVERSRGGISLTAAGHALVDHARRAEDAMESGFAAAQSEGGPALAGVVRLATPEVFGTQILAPEFVDFHRAYPDITLELVPESRFVSLANREADIAITLERPTSGRLMARRLIDYRLGLYASAGYLEACPPISSAGELHNHPFVSYIDEMIDLPGLRFHDDFPEMPAAVFRSSSSVAQMNAVSAGLGLGLLHVYATVGTADLVRVLPTQIDVSRSYWLIMPEDRHNWPKVRAVVDFIYGVIDKHRVRF